LQYFERGVIIKMKKTLPVPWAGKNATANTFLKGAKFLFRCGGKDAAPTCMRKGL